MPDLHDDVVVPALAELRETRRRRRIGEWHVFDALYRAYVAAIGGSLGITFLSGLIGDEPLSPADLRRVAEVGPAVVGSVVAVVLALALRSGARGGPLALEAAEVRWVLLAPVDRDVALRRPALRQLRFASFAGMVTGAVVGLLAYRRLTGPPVEWVLSGAGLGAGAAVAGTGLAMVASGRRLRPGQATAGAAALLAWSTADLAASRVTSPASLAGRAALWPLGPSGPSVEGVVFGVSASVAVAGALLLAGLGLRWVGGMSLEAAERRGRLVTHLRFAATFQDLRTVMLLRRQLAAEVPRSRPWISLRPATGSVVSSPAGRGAGWVVWRRDWRAILRWPVRRFVRLGSLGVLAGLSTAGAWAGTTPLVVVAGAALFVAALDATEGLAQEVDHPDRRDSLPLPASALHLRHLAAPTVLLSLAGLAGVGAAALVTGSPGLALEVGLPLVVPTGAAAAGAAAVNALRSPADPARLMADSTGFMMVVRHAWPPALATVAPAVTLLVHTGLESQPEADPAGLAATAALNVGILVILVFGWVRHREGIAGMMAGERLARVGQ